MGKIESWFHLTLCAQINTKVHEENIGKYLCDVGLVRLFGYDTKEQLKNEKKR